MLCENCIRTYSCITCVFIGQIITIITSITRRTQNSDCLLDSDSYHTSSIFANVFASSISCLNQRVCCFFGVDFNLLKFHQRNSSLQKSIMKSNPRRVEAQKQRRISSRGKMKTTRCQTPKHFVVDPPTSLISDMISQSL